MYKFEIVIFICHANLRFVQYQKTPDHHFLAEIVVA